MINKNFSKLPVIGAAVSLIGAIAEIIYGATYAQYADWAVVLAFLVGAALLAVYALIPNAATECFSLLGTVASAWGLGLFIVNSYNIWADVNGNLEQYGSLTGEFNFFSSEGGPIPAIVIIVIALIAVLIGIITCFMGRKEIEA